MPDTGAFGRAAVGIGFNPHTHLIPTEKPVGIPTESTYPQNHDIIHTHYPTIVYHTPTLLPVCFRPMYVFAVCHVCCLCLYVQHYMMYENYNSICTN